MPRFFFNFEDGTIFLDQDGLELAGISEARVQAVVASGEMIRDHAEKFWTGEEWRMWVTDEAGETVCTLRFSAE